MPQTFAQTIQLGVLCQIGSAEGKTLFGKALYIIRRVLAWDFHGDLKGAFLERHFSNFQTIHEMFSQCFFGVKARIGWRLGKDDKGELVVPVLTEGQQLLDVFSAGKTCQCFRQGQDLF